MDNIIDFSVMDTPIKPSPSVIYKMNGNILTLVVLDDSNNFYKFDAYPVEIWLGIQDQLSPTDIYNQIIQRDKLPADQFKKDFNNFINFLKTENLVIF